MAAHVLGGLGHSVSHCKWCDQVITASFVPTSPNLGWDSNACLKLESIVPFKFIFYTYISQCNLTWKKYIVVVKQTIEKGTTLWQTFMSIFFMLSIFFMVIGHKSNIFITAIIWRIFWKYRMDGVNYSSPINLEYIRYQIFWDTQGSFLRIQHWAHLQHHWLYTSWTTFFCSW